MVGFLFGEWLYLYGRRTGPTEAADLLPGSPLSRAHASELDRARRVNEQLEAAPESRVLIEQAKGLLAGERGITVGQAFTILRNHARSRNAPVRSIAQAVVQLGLRP